MRDESEIREMLEWVLAERDDEPEARFDTDDHD